jgi:hypothetical protein
MKPELIVMLTHHDRTVPNALELFEASKDIPVSHWGFKDVGLSHTEMKELVRCMKAAGKITFLEVVSLSEDEGMAGAKLAVEAGFDILMGTIYFDRIHRFLMDKPIRYYPFPGHVYNHPSILDGEIPAIVQHARWLESKGVHGLDLLGYRYVGEARKLLQDVVKATTIPIVCAGSIASLGRIAEVWEAGAWGLTIGSAFFDRQFVPGGTFQQNVQAVVDWLSMTGESDLDLILK